MNGSGKSSLLRLLADTVTPDSGKVVRGKTVRLAHLSQELSELDPKRRVLETVEEVRKFIQVGKKEWTASQLLERLGFKGDAQWKVVGDLSGGERRRVEIARALATQPHYILLDEPLAGIDPIAVGEIRDLVGHLKNRGIGVLITDHNVRETLEIIDRAYIMHDGKVLMEGRPQEVVAHVDVRRVYLGERFSL